MKKIDSESVIYSGPDKLHLGCGRNIRKGWVNLDRLKNPGVDVVADLEQKLPFPDESFSLIFADNVLEHISNLDGLMNELHRILKHGGKLKVIVPHFSCASAYHDPTHKRFFGYRTFDYYAGYSFYYNFKFSIVRKRLIFGKSLNLFNYFIEPLANIFPLFYEDSFLRAFPCRCMYVELSKEK